MPPFRPFSPRPRRDAPTRVTKYKGVQHSLDAMLEALRGPRGAIAPKVRFWAEDIVREVAPKDYLSEALAIRYWVNDHVPYLRDPLPVEWIRDPVAMLEEIEKYGEVRADCDEIALLTAALWMAVGNPASFITASFGPGPATHVFARCHVAKMHAPLVTDSVAGTREAKMVRSIVNFTAYPLD